MKKKKREGKERERRKEIGTQVPARPSTDGPVIAWRAHACFFENVHLPLGRQALGVLGSAKVPARNANRAAAGRQWRSGSIRS